jgi:hypothetical protein
MIKLFWYSEGGKNARITLAFFASGSALLGGKGGN